MARTSAALHALNRGEVSRFALARVDVERLRLSAEEQVNFLPTVLGPMTLRPGLAYIGGTKSDAVAKLVPFVFAFDDTAQIELTDSVMRVRVNDALVTRPSVSTSVTNGDFSSGTGWTTSATAGCTSSISGGKLTLTATARGGSASCTRSVSVAGGDQNKEHGLRIVVERGPVTFFVGSSAGATDYIDRATLDTGTHSFAFTPTGPTFHVNFESTLRRSVIVDSVQVDSTGTLELPTPWSATDLPKIRVTQSGDVIFVACNGRQQRKIERRSTHGWGVSLYLSENGPFKPQPRSDVTMTPSVYEGNGTLTASKAFFTSNMVGMLFRVFTKGQTNEAILGAIGAVSEPIRINGAGSNRNVTTHCTGSGFTGTVVFERSYEDPESGGGFIQTNQFTGTGQTSVGDTAGMDNVVVWYRARMAAYTAGTATVKFSGQGLAADPTTYAGIAGICRVIGYTSSTVVDIEVLAPFSQLVASDDWQIGEWGDYEGWPDAVELDASGRLWWFGRDKNWGSESDNYYSFPYDAEGESAPINRSFGKGPVESAAWALALRRILVGRPGSIGSIWSSALDEPITALNYSAKLSTDLHAGTVPAVAIDQTGIFIEGAGKKLIELTYSAEKGDYKPRDLTRFHPDIAGSGSGGSLEGLAVQRLPDTRIHCVRSDGQGAVLVYEPDDDVLAWYRVDTACGVGGEIEDWCVMPASGEDVVYCVVKRTINGATKRFIEKFARLDQCRGLPEARLADSHIYYEGAAVTTITGLAHLEGEEVVVWGWNTATPFTVTLENGSPQTVGRDLGTFTVSGGQITGLASAVTNAVVGLAYTATFKSAKLAYAAAGGTALTKNKKINTVGLILNDTHHQGIEIGQDFTTMDHVPQSKDGFTVADHTIFTDYDLCDVPCPGGWKTDSRLCLRAAAPRPCTVSAAIIDISTNG
jgi:hypothetical protein